jgi:DNA-3-methyladenine glycosylase
MIKLNYNFYRRNDVVLIAEELLGKVIHSNIDGFLTSGIITETEAYAGSTDRASHAFGNRRTARTEVMYSAGGVAYVYLCYGIHHLFNVVTGEEGNPHAVLLRGIHPLKGIEHMKKRRKISVMKKTFSSGPGSCAKALGFHVKHSGIDLTKNLIWIADQNIKIPKKEIITTPRIGIDYAGKDAKLPYRFVWEMG